MNQPTRIEPIAGSPTFHKHTCPKCGREHELVQPPNPHMDCWSCLQRGHSGSGTADRERALEKSIPAHYAWATFDSKLLMQRVKDPGLIARAHNAVQAPRVVIHGKAGTGKTSLGAAMLREAFQTTKSTCLFVTAAHLGSSRLKHGLGDGEPAIVEQCLRAKFLLIDDLGTELAANTSRGEIADVISQRYDAGRAIWVTTWLQPTDFESRYGDGIQRRLTEGAKIISLGAPK